MTYTFDQCVNDVLRVLSGYGLVQDRQSPLQANIGTTDTTISVADATGFEEGVVEIGTEVIYVISVDYASNILTVASGGRGYYGTIPVAHAAGERATMAPTFPRDQVAQAVNEAIVNTAPTLFGVATTSFTWSPVITTYDVPAEVDRILVVRTETIGPSREQPVIRRYSFNPLAPNGPQITIEEGGFPGRDIHVTYAKVPSEITWGDPFTNTGLRDTAKMAVRYAAASALCAYMDVSRLSVGSAEADQFDQSHNPVGTAAKISAQLYQRYQVELEQERKRLRSTTPAAMNLRTR